MTSCIPDELINKLPYAETHVANLGLRGGCDRWPGQITTNKYLPIEQIKV